MKVHQLLRANLYSGVLRAWTGDGELQIEEPFPALPEANDPPSDTLPKYRDGLGFEGIQDGQARFTLRGQSIVGTPLGGRKAVVFYVGSDDGAPPFRVLPIVTQGLLDSPKLYAGEFSVGLVPPRYDRPVETWSNEEHQADYPGDTFFSQRKALEKGVSTWWPQVPPYHPQHRYRLQTVRTAVKRTRGQPTASPGVRLVAGKDVALRPSLLRLVPGR